MEEQTFVRWVELPEAQPVRFDDLPALIAGALHVDEMAQAIAEAQLEGELRAMVTAGELMVRNALTLGPHTFPMGQALRDSVLLPEDLRPLLAKRGMGLRLKADIAHPFPGALNEEHHEGGAMPALHNAPIDWGAYRFREHFTLFEVACLVHRLDPSAVFDNADRAIRRRGGAAAEVLRSTSTAAAELLHLNPAAFFIAPVGDALERLKRAAGSRLGLTVNADRARAMAAMLGVPYPPELEREAPAAVQAPADVPRADRGECVKRAALIERNRRRWRSIERDLKDASSNGLSAAARAADRPGFWWEGDALKWAEARNKVEGAQTAPVSLASVVHRLAG